MKPGLRFVATLDDDVGAGSSGGPVLRYGGEETLPGLPTRADIVRATYYVTDIKDADAVFAVCGATLGEIRPAATIVVVSALLKPEMKVEIEAVARIRSR